MKFTMLVSTLAVVLPSVWGTTATPGVVVLSTDSTGVGHTIVSLSFELPIKTAAIATAPYTTVTGGGKYCTSSGGFRLHSTVAT